MSEPEIAEKPKLYSPVDHAEALAKALYLTVKDQQRRIEVAEADKARLREVINWVDSWVSQPVGAYSVHALDGLFGMTRDKIAAL